MTAIPYDYRRGSVLVWILVLAAVLSTAIVTIGQRRVQDSRAVTLAVQRESSLREVRDWASKRGQELRDASLNSTVLAQKTSAWGCVGGPTSWKPDSDPLAAAAGMQLACRTVTSPAPVKYYLSARKVRIDPASSQAQVLAQATVEVISLPSGPPGCPAGQALHYGVCTPQDCRWDEQNLGLDGGETKTRNLSCGDWDYTEYDGSLTVTGTSYVSCTATRDDDDGPDSTDKLRVTCRNNSSSDKNFKVKLRCCRND